MRAAYRTFWNGICERRLDAPLNEHILSPLTIFILDMLKLSGH